MPCDFSVIDRGVRQLRVPAANGVTVYQIEKLQSRLVHNFGGAVGHWGPLRQSLKKSIYKVGFALCVTRPRAKIL